MRLQLFRIQSIATIRLVDKSITSNEKIGTHRRMREELASATRTWLASRSEQGEFLGFGMEGCVWRKGEYLVKLFYPYAAKKIDFAQLAKASIKTGRVPTSNTPLRSPEQRSSAIEMTRALESRSAQILRL